jgi:hypothetical protein
MAAYRGRSTWTLDGVRAFPVTPENSLQTFESWLVGRAFSPQLATPGAGVREMLNFYSNVPAVGCVSEMGDMLLFQWGTYDWGAGTAFEIDMTRQFINATLEDDDAISQLHLTYRFNVAPAFVDLGAGNRWCRSTDEIAEFVAYLDNNAVLQAVTSAELQEVSLTYDCV